MAQTNDVEHAKQQKEERSATEREKVYQKMEKERKRRVAKQRGVKYLYPVRNDARALRAAARGRTFQSRCSRIPRKSEAAAKSRKWRDKLRTTTAKWGGLFVRKRNYILPRDDRAALAISFQKIMGSNTTEAEKQTQADKRKTDDPEANVQLVADLPKRESHEERKQRRAKLARARKDRFQIRRAKEPMSKKPVDEAARKKRIAELACARKVRYNLKHGKGTSCKQKKKL